MTGLQPKPRESAHVSVALWRLLHYGVALPALIAVAVFVGPLPLAACAIAYLLGIVVGAIP